VTPATVNTPLCQVEAIPRKSEGIEPSPWSTLRHVKLGPFPENQKYRALHHSNTPPCIVRVHLANQKVSSPSAQSTLCCVKSRPCPRTHQHSIMSPRDVSSSLFYPWPHGVSCTTCKVSFILMACPRPNCILCIICNVPLCPTSPDTTPLHLKLHRLRVTNSQWISPSDLNVHDNPSSKRSMMRTPLCYHLAQTDRSHYCPTH